jgi:hypothetical protein
MVSVDVDALYERRGYLKVISKSIRKEGRNVKKIGKMYFSDSLREVTSLS